jgi:4-hydroxy-tetrahydrodipicolinate synthase
MTIDPGAGGLFAGVGVALVTLFRDDGALDAPATAELALRLVEAGVRAVIVAGSTGEAATLEAGERTELVRAVADTLQGAVPVVAGTGAPSARQAAALTHAAVDAGADAVLTLSPPGAADARPYYDAVAKQAGGRPVLAYHFPRVSAPGIPVDVIGELPVTGLKDSSGDPARLLDELEIVEPGFSLYTGSASLLLLAGAVGCAGAILALANFQPERCARAFAGDASAQRELAPYHRLAEAAFPRGVKALTAERYGTSTVARAG